MTAIELLDTRNEIVKLRVRGETQAVIAAKVGLSVATVGKVLREEFHARAAVREDLIATHKFELDWMRQLVKDRIVDRGDGWDRKDVELVLRLMESERKLFGLDQPTKIDVNHLDAATDEELAEECRRFGIPTALPPAPTVPADPELIPDAEYSERVG